MCSATIRSVWRRCAAAVRLGATIHATIQAAAAHLEAISCSAGILHSDATTPAAAVRLDAISFRAPRCLWAVPAHVPRRLARCRLCHAGCALPAALCRLRRTGCALPAALCRLRSAGCAMLAAPCQARPASCALLAAPCWLRPAGCGLRAASCHLPPGWLRSAGCAFAAAPCQMRLAGCHDPKCTPPAQRIPPCATPRPAL